MRLTASLQRSCLVVVALLLVIWPRLLLSAGSRELPRLRSGNPVIVRSIAQADQQSMTFHGLLEDIARTDGIVYIETGVCGHGVRACVPHSIARSGSFRLLRILIDRDYTKSADGPLAGVIAHELQHALEILANPKIIDGAAMFMFYNRETPTRGGAFETVEAIRIGDRVASEMALSEQLHPGRVAGTDAADSIDADPHDQPRLGGRARILIDAEEPFGELVDMGARSFFRDASLSMENGIRLRVAGVLNGHDHAWITPQILCLLSTVGRVEEDLIAIHVHPDHRQPRLTLGSERDDVAVGLVLEKSLYGFWKGDRHRWPPGAQTSRNVGWRHYY